MYTILAGTVLLSALHALIPSHWLPIVAFGREYHWSKWRTLSMTFWAGLAHVVSTLLLGLLLAWAGKLGSAESVHFLHHISPFLLIVLGIVYIYRHYYHHHFHLPPELAEKGVFWTLVTAMFLSPCLEIEGYFFNAGA
jgi:nickel/cobalt transporter (NicO) family protein